MADLEAGDHVIQPKVPEPKLCIEELDGSNSTVTSKAESLQASDVVLDPDIAVNWPLGKKVYNMGVPSLLCFIISFGASVYTPGIPDIMRDFHVTETTATLGLTTYTLGLAFGPMISAPISESLGRMGTYRIAVPISTLFTLGAGFAPNMAAFAILRFLAGLVGSSPLSVAAGTAADLFAPQYRATAGAILLYTPFLGPALGPVIGGFVTQNKGWQWAQYTIVFFTVPAYIATFWMSETYTKIILQRREEKKQAKNAAVTTLLMQVLYISILRPVKMLLVEPIVSFLSIYVAFNFAVLFSFFGSIPFVFERVYGFNREMSSLIFLGVGLGCTLSVPTVIILDKLIYQKEWQISVQKGRAGMIAQEHRLWPAMLGAFGLPVGLFWFAWSAKKDVHWIVPALATIPYSWGNLCIFISGAIYLIDTYAALTAASALAATGLLRYILGAVFPLFTIKMYETLQIRWATSLLGFISLGMLPVPWVMYKWGPKIRARSGFDTNKF